MLNFVLEHYTDDSGKSQEREVTLDLNERTGDSASRPTTDEDRATAEYVAWKNPVPGWEAEIAALQEKIDAYKAANAPARGRATG